MAGRPWTEEEYNKLRELVALKKYSFNQMATHFDGRSGTSLRKRALKMGLTNEEFILFKHSCNRDFFAVPNSINCYVAGFYAADGCISDNPTTRVLTLAISTSDIEQLRKFKDLFKYTGRIDTMEARGEVIGPGGKMMQCRSMSALRLYSAYKMTEDLEKHFGLTSNKTYRLPPPSLVDPHFKLCYIAGIIDGDGCINISNQDRLSISYTSSSRLIMEWLKSEIENMELRSIRDKVGAKIRKVEHANAYTYQIAGLKAIDLIRRVQKLKLEGVPILDRKWDNDRLNTYMVDFEKRFSLEAA